ncbi:MAG TPA: hypothetical protein VIN73_06135 [Vicingaceae bacterium]
MVNDLYSEGNIIYFDPFYFPNGQSSAKPKYFLVLRNKGDDTILASLPTRGLLVPEDKSKSNGCIELSDIKINCFAICNKTVVTTCRKKFPIQTYIYGHKLEDYKMNMLLDVYRVDGVDYHFFGKMKPNLFNKLIKCLKQSSTIKMKYLRMLD